MSNKISTRARQQKFLLTFFNDEEKYEEKEINGFFLVKRFNRDGGKFMIYIYENEINKKNSPREQPRLFR